MGYGNFRGSGGSGGFRGGGNRGGFRRSFNRGPREMTKIKCSKCGKEDEVPFKPRDGSTVLCKECYFKEKGIEPRKPFVKKEDSEQEELSEELGEDSDMSEDSSEEEL